MKFSSLSLFLILLIVLVIVTLMCKWCKSNMEGFIAYKHDVTELDKITLTQYSPGTNELYKIYDNTFFDNKNGNLVEVEGSAYDENATPAVGNDDTGVTISKIHIAPRIGNSIRSYEITSPTDTLPEPETSIQNSYNSRVYKSRGTTTDSYYSFIMPWHENTYIHMMNMSSSTATPPIPQNISTSAFTYNSSAITFDLLNSDMSGITESRNDSSSDNNKMVLEPLYNSERKLYQISQFVHYDISNSNLLITTGDNENKTIKVHDRSGNSTLSLTASGTDNTEATTNGDDETIANTAFRSKIIPDISGQNMVLYVPNAQKTLVALIHYNNSNNLDLRNVCRFTPNGLDNGETDVIEDEAEENNDNAVENSYSNNNNNNNLPELDNYLLKTQIVPPVCPACPSCPSCNYNKGQNTCCSNCGGNGGSGTNDKNGNSLVKGDKVSEASATPIKDAVGAVGNVAGGAVGAAGDVASGAVGAAGNVASGAVGAAGNVATGAVGAVGDVASGILGTVGNVLGSGVNAAGNVLPENSSTTTNNQINQQQNQQLSQQGPVNGSTDPYSYYGQLPARQQGNYMPRTTDFSAFGR